MSVAWTGGCQKCGYLCTKLRVLRKDRFGWLTNKEIF